MLEDNSHFVLSLLEPDAELNVQNGVIIIAFETKHKGYPNAFQRLMYRILLGWKWKKLENHR